MVTRLRRSLMVVKTVSLWLFGGWVGGWVGGRLDGGERGVWNELLWVWEGGWVGGWVGWERTYWT